MAEQKTYAELFSGGESIRDKMAEAAGDLVLGHYYSLNLAESLAEAGEQEGATVIQAAAEVKQSAANGILKLLQE